MLSFFSHTKNEGLSLIVDIQSGLIRASLVSLKKNTQPHIIYIASRPILYKNQDGEYLTNMMAKTLEEISGLIAEEGMLTAKEHGYDHGKIQTIHYVLSSPWAISQSKTIKIHYETRIEITDVVINNIVNAERTSFIEKFREGHFDKEYEFDLAFVEQKIFEVRLNGYPVEDYSGKKTQDIEISFAITTSSKGILQKIHDASTKSLRTKNTSHHSALLLQYSALRKLVTTGDEYISLHVHGELTDIIVVKRGISSYLASFPFGTSTLVRKMSVELKNSIESSESLLCMYKEEKLEASENQEIEKIVKPLFSSWQNECLTSFGSIGEKMILPRVIYLSTHSYYELFEKAFYGTQFEVIAFDRELVDKAVTFEKTREKSLLMGMYALALNDMV